MRLWHVYVPNLKPAMPGEPFWRLVAAGGSVEAREAVLRLYEPDEAAWTEVST